MKTLKLMGLAAAAILGLTNVANAAATAAGDKLDGLVELQDLGISALGGAGGMAILVISVIIAAIMFTFTQRWVTLAIPLALGLFLSIGFNMATSFGGVSAQVGDYEITSTQAATTVGQQS